jgi:iron-sulfur cluster assembly accessory protein
MEASMLQETGIQSVTLSPAAATAVRNIIAEKRLEGYALRVFVAGGGCCSVQFGMALDNQVHENDLSFNFDGVQVIVDDTSIQYLQGGKIDFINDPQHGQGFIVDSPAAKKEAGECGCGNHSAEPHEAAGGACACGGSCGCN